MMPKNFDLDFKIPIKAKVSTPKKNTNYQNIPSTSTQIQGLKKTNYKFDLQQNPQIGQKSQEVSLDYYPNQTNTSIYQTDKTGNVFTSSRPNQFNRQTNQIKQQRYPSSIGPSSPNSTNYSSKANLEALKNLANSSKRFEVNPLLQPEQNKVQVQNNQFNQRRPVASAHSANLISPANLIRPDLPDLLSRAQPSGLLSFQAQNKKNQIANFLPKIALALLVTVCLLASGIWAFAENKKSQQQVKPCQNGLNSFEEYGVLDQSHNCQIAKKLFILPSSRSTRQKFVLQEESLTAKVKQTADEIEQTQSRIDKLFEQLKVLEVNADTTKIEITTKNLGQTLKFYEDKEKELIQLRDQNGFKVEKEISDLENLIDKFKDKVETGQFSIWLEDYKTKDLGRQIDSFSELKNQNMQLKKSLVQKFSIGEKNGLYQFSPSGFRDLYNSFLQPNTVPASTAVSITGDEAADEKIAKLALQRGYKARDLVENKDILINVEDEKAQPKAAKAWQEMKQQAASQGIFLILTSGYRDNDDQREIFNKRLEEAVEVKMQMEYSPQVLLKDEAAESINFVLQTTAPPGFSRHHSGFTIDIGDSTAPVFASSPGFSWISQNNYENAKKFGFIPSYPSGTELQGPEPEEWEYVYIGREYLSVK